MQSPIKNISGNTNHYPQPSTSEEKKSSLENKGQESVLLGSTQGNEKAVDISEEEMSAMLQELRQSLDMPYRGLSFELDEKTGETIVRVVDKESGEVIRQIPPDYALKLVHILHSEDYGGKGQLFSGKV